MLILGLFMLHSCSPTLQIPASGNTGLTGTAFYKIASTFNWKQRDSIFLDAFFRGNTPSSRLKLRPFKVVSTDSTGQLHKMKFFATTDYLSIGNNSNWARVPITPMAGQLVADSLHCYLPTRKLADIIHEQARVKLDPIPMYAFRDSTVSMWQHHLMIEGQRKGRNGVVSGIKKDIVLCSEDAMKGKPNRVAIYGWHLANNKPIQPLYTGHVNWYVDYSHGIRLIYRKMKVDGHWMDYSEMLENPELRKLVSDETGKLMNRY